MTSRFQLHWSHNLQARLRGIRLARESGDLLVWDHAHRLHLFNRAGKLQAQLQSTEPIVDAAIADDGSAAAFVVHDGTVKRLLPDFSVAWKQTIKSAVLALTLSSLGEYLAIAQPTGLVLFVDATGKEVGQFASERALKFLSFLPGEALLVGCAEFGLVGSFDIKGKWQWRDAPVVHSGSMTVSGAPAMVTLACFSEGLLRYDALGVKLTSLNVAQACAFVSASYDGKRILVGTLAHQVCLLDTDSGQPLDVLPPAGNLAGIILGPLGNRAFVALKEGPIQAYKIL